MNQFTVTGSRLTPNIGLEELQQVEFNLVFKLKTKAGSEQLKPAEAGESAGTQGPSTARQFRFANLLSARDDNVQADEDDI